MEWLKQLNMFRSAKRRTAAEVRQQHIITRVYLTLLISEYAMSCKKTLRQCCTAHSVILVLGLILLVFTITDAQTLTKTVANPPLATYMDFYRLNLNELTCPCSNVAIPYHQFISLTPIFHQVCSSDFVTESWIKLLSVVDTVEYHLGLYEALGQHYWPGFGARHFKLLSTLCGVANTTTYDAVHRLYLQSFVSSIVLTKTAFDIQLNSTLTQFFRSLTLHFDLLVNATRLLMQVDQPYTKFENAQLVLGTITDEIQNRKPLKV